MKVLQYYTTSEGNENLIDLESRGRRYNIRFAQLKESAEAGDLVSFLNKILCPILHLRDSNLHPEIEKAHWAQSKSWRHCSDHHCVPALVGLLLWEAQYFFVG